MSTQTTDLMYVINELQDKTWKHITASALDAVKWQKKVIPAAPVVDPAPITVEPEFEILDDDSDSDVNDDPALAVQA